jgi:hypothetical protein
MKIYNAIIFYAPEMGIKPKKYRNISKLDNFLKFARNSGGWYVNLYNAIDKKFEARKYVTGASS